MMTQSEGLACPSSFPTPWFCIPHPRSLAILLMQDEVLAGWNYQPRCLQTQAVVEKGEKRWGSR